ncbi:hypothetical protein [Bacillus sp. YKCMOAS1]|uniref:hypothetical protein n=1 Tax=Bacillus sp. YKCMOAS1 TaxID=2925778 RepID=UPI0025543617|nr:hypothetical protein [Bacillus sp. YKCMOAS1]
MNEHMKTEGKSAVKNKKELETLDTQRFLALLQLFPLDNRRYSPTLVLQHFLYTIRFWWFIWWEKQSKKINACFFFSINE